MSRWSAYRCQRGAEAALENARRALTDDERQHWLLAAQVWRSRLKNAA